MSISIASFYVTGGTLRQDAPSYVERQADKDLYEGLLQGDYCYVLHARQMGKSSLMVHTTTRLRKEGVAVAAFELTALGQNLTVEQWYDGLTVHLGRQLDLEEELEQYWLAHERWSPLQRWLDALREVVLAKVPGRIVIFIDEIDAVRSLPFSTDEFFAAIRECYNRRTQDPEFTRLTFCLLGVATPSDLIQDTRTTPFNIGRRIELTDFTPAEAAPLAQGLVGRTPPPTPPLQGEGSLGPSICPTKGAEPNAPPSLAGKGVGGIGPAQALLDRVLYWTRGHPYLTQRLCQAVAEEAGRETADGRRQTDQDSPSILPSSVSRLPSPADVDRHCEALFLSPQAQEKDDNLLFVRERLLRSEADLASLLDLYGRVRSGKRVSPDDTNPLLDLLRLSGVVRLEGKRLVERNRIYARVFDRNWVLTHMPEAELRRQRAAYRRGVVRTASVAGGVVAVVAGLARKEQQASRHARELLARAQLDRGVRRLEAGDNLGLLDLLQAHNTAAGLSQLQRAIATVWAGWAAACDHRLIHLMGHEDAVNALAISPDGKLLATGSSDRTARLWDRATGQPHGPPLHHEELVWAVALSPDGKLLATASADHTAQVWETATGRPYGPRLCHQGVVRTVAISPDGKLLATGSEDQTARLWEIATGQPHGLPLRHQGVVSAVAFSPDGALLAAVSRDGSVHLWETASGQPHCPPMDDPFPVQLTFSPDGKLLAAGGAGAGMWETATGQRRGPQPNNTPGGHEGRVLGVAFSPDGKRLASIGWDGTARLWHTADGTLASPPLPHHGAVLAAAFSPDGKRLATASADATVRLWDAATGQPSGPPLRHQGTVQQVGFSPDGKWLAAASLDGSVRLWETELPSTSGQPHSLPLKDQGTVFGVAFSPDGKRLGTASGASVRLWKATTGRPLGRLLESVDTSSLAFSPDGRFLAAGCRDRKTRLWEVTSKRLHGRPLEHPSWIPDLAFSPDGKWLATGGSEGALRLWDVATGRLRGGPAKHPDSVIGVAFSPDGKRLASATNADGTVRLWDPVTCRARGQLRLGPDPIEALAFSPDGKWLATGSDNGTARLWDASTGEPRGLPLGHQKTVKSVAFSPDGRLLATGSMDHTARVWELSTGQPCGPPLRHEGRVSRVALSPDGKLLATASWDTTTRLWCLPPPPAGPREMALRTWVELGARLDAHGNAVAIPWQEWRAFREELRAIDARKALALARDPWWACSGEGDRHARRGEWKEAAACCSQAIRRGASDWRVWWQRGEAYAALGQQRQAAADFAGAFRQGADWLHVVPSSGDGVVQLQWQPVPYAVGYHVYRDCAERGDRRERLARLTDRPLTETVFTDRAPGLPHGQPQTYGVAALFQDASGRLVEAPPVTVLAAPAP